MHRRPAVERKDSCQASRFLIALHLSGPRNRSAPGAGAAGSTRRGPPRGATAATARRARRAAAGDPRSPPRPRPGPAAGPRAPSGGSARSARATRGRRWARCPRSARPPPTASRRRCRRCLPYLLCLPLVRPLLRWIRLERLWASTLLEPRVPSVSRNLLVELRLKSYPAGFAEYNFDAGIHQIVARRTLLKI